MWLGCAMVLGWLVASIGFAAGVPTPDEQTEMAKNLMLIREIGQKRLTLQYLGDPRSAAFLKTLIADFSPELRKNFRANITGAYRREILANYDAKLAELTTTVAKEIGARSAFESLLTKVIDRSPPPLDRAFAPLVKNIAEQRRFQAAQGVDPVERATAQASLKVFEPLAARLAAVAAEDPYPLVAGLYAKTAAKDFPIHWFDDAQHDIAYTTNGDDPTPPAPLGLKEWTVLVYIAADNDLERQGLTDINEMEAVGSTDKVNIVVQVDRMDGGKGDTITDGNWVGTRRYYVEKDRDKKKISSRMVMNLGEADMGQRQTLADFLSWGVQTYPARRTAVVVWNHGAGWLGVCSDESSGRILRLADVAWALREGQKHLPVVDGKPGKFAVVDFDACLMGTIEVAYELRDVAEFMVGSEENEPGSGMPYKDYLGPLAENPTMPPRELVKRMAATYVQSYAKGGSATNKVIEGTAVTKAGYDLGKIADLAKLFDQLGRQLLQQHDIYADVLVGEESTFARIRRYNDETLVDIVDLVKKLGKVASGTLPEVQATCAAIEALIGYPLPNDRLSEPVIITSTQPGKVIWGYNGWRTPPKELRTPRTRIFRSRLGADPLVPIAENLYACKIGPFTPVVDPALRKRVYVEEINYQIMAEDGTMSPKRTARQGKEHVIVSRFPAASPMVIEGHTQGMGDSHGLSIYYPSSVDFRSQYRTLAFAKDTAWDEFLARVPVFRRRAPVLLTGFMVEDPMTLPLVAQALKANGAKFQVLWNPGVYAYRFREILGQFADDGLVITDSITKASMGQLAPSGDDLAAYLDEGGRVLIAAQSAEQNNLHRQMLEKYFKFDYVDDEREDLRVRLAGVPEAPLFTFNGPESSATADDITIMTVGEPGRLFLQDSQGRGAGIAIRAESPVTGRTYAGVYLGFRFEAVDGAPARSALVKAALEFLQVGGKPPSPPSE